MRRGILGGTFDPIHIAHLVAAEAALRHLGLDAVTFLPAGVPWQKAGSSVSAAHHRLAMTELATAEVEYFTVDDREVHRDGPTYTVDTLEELDGEDVTLILGADAASRLSTWHRSSELLAQVEIAVVPRPGTDPEMVSSGVTWIPMPELAVSASQLRAMRAAGDSIRFLVPDRVWAYIEEHELYV